MKTIYFIRHAKSSWDQPISDVDRPLNDRGKNDAHHIGKKLLDKELKFDAIYSSIANRAQSTANIVVSEMGIDQKQISLKKELYTFESNGVVNFIKQLPDTHQNILVLGHNPAFTAVVNLYGSIQFDNLPTCGVVAIKFDIQNWYDLDKGTTLFYMLPKLLGYR